jgi:xanthine dehydrogenase molybdopterin-binding subunit B
MYRTYYFCCCCWWWLCQIGTVVSNTMLGLMAVAAAAAACLLFQGLIAAEMVMERVTRHLNKSPLEVRQPHLYKEGDVTHFGMVSSICVMC